MRGEDDVQKNISVFRGLGWGIVFRRVALCSDFTVGQLAVEVSDIEFVDAGRGNQFLCQR